jgi:hypothetical protein
VRGVPVIVGNSIRLASVAVCMGMCAPCLALTAVNPGFPSDRRIGRLAHLYIQQYYLQTPKNHGHEIVMESYFRWAGGRTSVYRLARMGAEYLGRFRSLIRFALWSFGRTKLPDIMDLTCARSTRSSRVQACRRAWSNCATTTWGLGTRSPMSRAPGRFTPALTSVFLKNVRNLPYIPGSHKRH